jgi:predicted acylesterase/phospholipase RssA
LKSRISRAVSTIVAPNKESGGSTMSAGTKPSSIGITLSGGGFRATVFSLGALYYLVDRGLNNRIRYVASVSGGSVANACVAQDCDLSTVTAEQFEELVGRIGRKVAHEGLYRTPPAIGWMMCTLLLLLVSGTAAVMMVTIAFLLLLVSGTAAVMMVTIAGCALVLAITIPLTAGALQLRGTALGWALGWQFFRRHGGFTTLRDLSARPVRHALIATELSQGRPVFIESDWMHGPGMRHGYGKPGHLRLHRVVRWSCSVPALLPPGLLRTKSVAPESASRGETLDLPAWLTLVDGGVCNNLGTDYYDVTSALSFGTRPEGFYQAPDADLKITVDSSGGLSEAPVRFARVPFLGELLALPRNVAILYQNTIVPRLELAVPTIRIGHSPTMQLFVGTPKDAHGPEKVEQLRRANEIREYFREHFETHHEEKVLFEGVANASGRVPTTFHALGEEVTAQLLWHGYLSALAVCYSAYGIEPPDRLCHRTIYHFRRLVSDAPETIADPWESVVHECHPIRAVRVHPRL